MVLGPLLWILAYDGVLNIEYPDGVEPIAFSDDLALVVVGKAVEEEQHKISMLVMRVTEWMNGQGLTLAIQKTNHGHDRSDKFEADNF